MFRFRHVLLVALVTVLSFQCQTNASNSSNQREKKFFDLRAFFEAEIARLEKEEPRVKKEIEINGQREQRTQQAVDFEKELAIFIRSDINKPAWRDKYRIDSTLVSKQLTRLQYTAMDSSLKTRIMRIEFDQNGVEKIYISNRTQSPLIKSSQQLLFEPSKGYQIENQQDLSLSKDSQLSISAQFVE